MNEKLNKIFEVEKPAGNVYDYILKIFVDEDHPRDVYRAPFTQGDYAIATEGHMLCYIDRALTTVDNDSEILNYEKFTGEDDLEHWIDVSRLREKLSELSIKGVDCKKGEDVICKECHGEGTVIWEYGHYEEEWDCPRCDGSGYECEAKYYESTEAFEFTRNGIVYVSRFNYFNANFIAKLVRVAVILGEDKIRLVKHAGRAGATTFRIGNVHAAIMPRILDDTNKDYEVVKVTFSRTVKSE